MELNIPIGELETLSRILSVVAALAGLGWVFMSTQLNASRTAALYFCAANFMVVLGDVAAHFRGPGLSLLDYYQTFNLAHITILTSVFLFNSGMQELNGATCRAKRDIIVTLLIFTVVFVFGFFMGIRNPAIGSVMFVSGCISFFAFLRSYGLLRKHWSHKMSLALLWPFAVMGILFMMRFVDDVLSLGKPIDPITDSLRLKHLVGSMWTQLLLFLLVNASLAGQTLNTLFKKLQDQTDRLQHILDTAPVGVAVTAAGIIQFANPKVTELLNMKTGDAATQALVDPATREKIIAELKAHGSVTNMEVQMYCPRGTVRDLLVTYLPTDYEGKPGILGWMIDITERKRIEREIRQANDEQAAIFNAATMGIAFIKSSAIVRANHFLDELFGWPSGTLVGQPPHVWFTEKMDLAHTPIMDILRGEVHHSTLELRRKDGSRFWCRVSGSAVDPQDHSLGTVWTFDDVTAERKASELMREAKELAEDATRMKSDFLANMSHEIRTPMNAIIGMSHLALQTDLNSKQRNYIEKVDGAARNLLGIINDILDFSKIEAGKMRFETAEFHLEDVLENLADLCVIKAQDKGLELLFDVGADVPTALVGDSLRLGQVLLNLAGNAIKFTDHGEITIAIHVAHDKSTVSSAEVWLRFDIIDTGVGLNEEQRNRLFSAFSQADASTTRKYGGTGLGLTISQRLVELMEGQIDVTSAPGEGSTFSFTGKFGLQAEQRTRTDLSADVTDLRVLVVDDNARAREIMLAILESQKFNATAVTGGAQAVAELERGQTSAQPYGLVLMDWMMPGMDGLTTIQQIRSDPLLSHVPAFVMVTAHSRDELLEQAEGTRIDGLLLKPVGPSALLDSILTALGKEVVTRGRKHQRQQANQDAMNAIRGCHLLLVEDNLVNQELALEILQEAGIQVDVANNGAQAVGMVARNDYDGVLMDCQMPVMDGFEATRKIREDSRFQNLPILAMTANAMSGDRELCLAAGMNDHIGKPIDVASLFTTLARWVHPKNPDQSLGTRTTESEIRLSSALPPIASLDLQQAMRRMGGNDKLVRKLIVRFAQTQNDAIARIETALASGDTPTAMREAHTVKGLAGNIGATQLIDPANQLELALKHNQPDQVPTALQALSLELQIVLKDISGAMDTTDAPTPAAQSAPLADPEMLGSDMRQLAELLADDDSRAGKLIEKIADDLRSLGQTHAANQLQKLIARYEFEEALDKLRESAAALNIPLQLP